MPKPPVAGPPAPKAPPGLPKAPKPPSQECPAFSAGQVKVGKEVMDRMMVAFGGDAGRIKTALKDILAEHMKCKWVLTKEAQQNAESLRGGGEVVGTFDTPEGTFILSTQADRSATKVVFNPAVKPSAPAPAPAPTAKVELGKVAVSPKDIENLMSALDVTKEQAMMLAKGFVKRHQMGPVEDLPTFVRGVRVSRTEKGGDVTSDFELGKGKTLRVSTTTSDDKAMVMTMLRVF